MSACNCREDQDLETGETFIYYCESCAVADGHCECGCDCGQCMYTDTPCDFEKPASPCWLCVRRAEGLQPVSLETIYEAHAEAVAEAERDRRETAALWSDDEGPLPMTSVELATEAAAFAAKALPILEIYAAQHGLESALAFGARLTGGAPAATMAGACQEIEASAKRNLEALTTAFDRDTAVACLGRELRSTGTAWTLEEEKEDKEKKEKEKEEEKAWFRRASLMAMSGRMH